MAISSLLKSSKNTNLHINKEISSLIAIGSILGGLAGKLSFNLLVLSMDIPSITAITQSTILASLLLLIYMYFKKKAQLKSFVLTNKLVILSVGFSLGFLSAFLSIGGGPLNVAMLVLLFSMKGKDAGINSIFIIFFSQLSALVLILFTTGFNDYHLSMLYFMIPGGIMGGIIGSHIVTKLTNSMVEKIFNVSILFIICINLYNIVKIALL
ncbi:hypothetical protein J416_01494 [Gracilibacillus halophilus YIM-C55.5]|uniref:Probable membrane transporter protein n=2 Tax=Gracilibacillus TaxID=74385 RepID=N4WYL8_9BACI|nr:hypothetical protein J416_01494 [Gracilibacillus halophilus YIM-C55.5]